MTRKLTKKTGFVFVRVVSWIVGKPKLKGILRSTGFQRTFILLRPPILCQLNNVKRDGEKKQNVNRAALVQHKFQDKPNKYQQTTGIPEHF